MLRYAARRILLLIPVLVIVSVVAFGLVRLIPGNPADVMLGDLANPSQVAALSRQMGLDQPIWVQFVRWTERAARGNLGTSIFFHQPVMTVILGHWGPTLSIVLLAMIVTIVIAVPLGIVSAVTRGTPWDSLAMAVAFLGTSMPDFWSGMILVSVFAVALRWVPVSGYHPLTDGWLPWFSTVITPAVALGFGQVGLLARMLRDSAINVLGDDYVRTARAKGLTEMRVIAVHVLRNTLIPVLTVLGNSVARLLSGAVIIETVFNIRGFGWLTVNAVLQRDYPLVEGCVLFAALIYSLVNLLVDLSFAVIDPRIRYE